MTPPTKSRGGEKRNARIISGPDLAAQYCTCTCTDARGLFRDDLWIMAGVYNPARNFRVLTYLRIELVHLPPPLN